MKMTKNLRPPQSILRFFSMFSHLVTISFTTHLLCILQNRETSRERGWSVRPSRPVTSHSPSDEFRAFSVPFPPSLSFPFPFRLMNHTLWFSLGKKCKKERTVNEICLVASRSIFGGFSSFLFTHKTRLSSPW